MSNFATKFAVIVAFLLLTPQGHTAPALRAPLDIVPPPMRDSLGSSGISGSTERVAPRSTTRSIAAIPGSRSALVQVGRLGGLEDAAIGVSSRYSSDAWVGTRAAYVIPLLQRLPDTIRLPALREMEITLLRSRAMAPPDKPRAISWFAARLQRLFALGDVESIVELVSLAGIEQRDADVARVLAEAYFALNDPDSACSLMRPSSKINGYARQEQFFIRGQIYCDLQMGNLARAMLNLDLNRDELGNDVLFSELALLLASGSEDIVLSRAYENMQLTFLHYLLLRLADQHIATNITNALVVMDARQGQDNQLPILIQLDSAARAIRAGLMHPRAFIDASLRADLSQYETAILAVDSIEASRDQLSSQGQNVPPLIHLAFALRALDSITPPAQRALYIADALVVAQAQGVWDLAVICLGDAIRSIPLDVTRHNYAAVFVPPLLYLGDFERMAQWVELGRDFSDPSLVRFWNGLTLALPYLVEEFELSVQVSFPPDSLPIFLAFARGLTGTELTMTENLTVLSRFVEPTRLGDFILSIQRIYGEAAPQDILLDDFAGLVAWMRKLGLYAEARKFSASVLAGQMAAPLLFWWADTIDEAVTPAKVSDVSEGDAWVQDAG